MPHAAMPHQLCLQPRSTVFKTSFQKVGMQSSQLKRQLALHRSAHCNAPQQCPDTRASRVSCRWTLALEQRACWLRCSWRGLLSPHPLT